MNGLQGKKKRESVQGAKARIGTRKGKNLICPICGKEFYRRPRDLKAKINTCSCRCLGEMKKTIYRGANNPKWRGGVVSRSDGRKYVYAPENPNAVLFGGTHILEYRLLAEKKIGRAVLSTEVVHHKDGDVSNNSLDNLEVITFAEHAKIHTKNRPRNEKGQFV